MARARACPSVVLPTPGTPSISRCPRARMLTNARRTTSSLPRITRRSEFSRSAALWETATAVSGDILFDSTVWPPSGRVTYVIKPASELAARNQDLSHDPRQQGSSRSFYGTIASLRLARYSVSNVEEQLQPHLGHGADQPAVPMPGQANRKKPNK